MPRISGLLLPTLIRFQGKTGTPTQQVKKTSISGWCFSSSPVASFGTVTFSTSTGPVPGPEEHGHVGRWDLFQYLLRGSSTHGSPILSTYEDCKSDDPPHPHHVSKNRGVEGPATPSFCTGRPVGRGRTEKGGPKTGRPKRRLVDVRAPLFWAPLIWARSDIEKTFSGPISGPLQICNLGAPAPGILGDQEIQKN